MGGKWGVRADSGKREQLKAWRPPPEEAPTALHYPSLQKELMGEQILRVCHSPCIPHTVLRACSLEL